MLLSRKAAFTLAGILIISLIAVFIAIKTNNNPQVISPINKFRCSQKVEGVGNCFALKPGYQFNSITQKCEEITTGGCSVNSPFISLEECSKACVKGWTPESPYEKLINEGSIRISGVSSIVKFDQTGSANYTQNGDKKILVLVKENAYLVDGGIVAIIEKNDNVVEDKNSSSLTKDGSYILFFAETGKNSYESQEFTRFSANSAYAKNFEANNSLLTVTYEEVPCGGQFEECGTKFTKSFRLEGNKLTPQ